MPVYHCMIELRSDARALAFAAAARQWLDHLQGAQLIRGWRLLRRTFGLASGGHPDLILEIELDGFDSLDAAFTALGRFDHDSGRWYDQMHQMIGRLDVGLYRPFPDPDPRERITLV